MKRFLVFLALVCGLTLSSAATSQTGYVVFYANGIDNTPNEAASALGRLERQYGYAAPDGRPITYQPAYASSLSFGCDLYEVYLQKKQPSDTIREFRRFLGGLASALISPELVTSVAAFRAACFTDVKAALANNGYSDEDLERQRQDIGGVISDGSGRKAVIVAHSQGNLYANRVFRALATDGAIAIVGVASPADEVVDHRGDDTYETSSSDVVINLLRDVSITTLAATFGFPGEPVRALHIPFNFAISGDWFGHNFQKVYANPDLMAWNEVRKQIDRALNFLSFGQPPAVLQYRITDLYAAGGLVPMAQANAINNLGQVAGYGTVGGTDPVTDPLLAHAVFWRPGGPSMDLGTLGGDLNLSMATGVNDAGQVTGFSYTNIAGRSAVRTFLWDAGVGMRRLGEDFEGFNNSMPAAINNLGQVVGSIAVNPRDRGFHPSLWDPGQGYVVQDLGVEAPYESGRASGINGSGTVAGTMAIGNSEARFGRAFVRSGGQTRLLPDPAPPLHLGSRAEAINASGTVVGAARFNDLLNLERAVLWPPNGSPVDLGALVEGFNSMANSVNDAGHVVGAAGTGNGDTHAFIWTAGTSMKDLNLLIDPADPLRGRFVLRYAFGINNAGQIVGSGNLDNTSPQRAFLLTPIPPTSP